MGLRERLARLQARAKQDAKRADRATLEQQRAARQLARRLADAQSTPEGMADGDDRDNRMERVNEVAQIGTPVDATLDPVGDYSTMEAMVRAGPGQEDDADDDAGGDMEAFVVGGDADDGADDVADADAATIDPSFLAVGGDQDADDGDESVGFFDGESDDTPGWFS
jgi:hypothetical protein